MADYDKFIDSILEYDTDKSREEIKEGYTIFDFAQTRYAECYIRMIDEYIKNEFKKTLNP